MRPVQDAAEPTSWKKHSSIIIAAAAKSRSLVSLRTNSWFAQNVIAY